MKKFLVIDGSSLAYRAFFALPPLTNGKGEFTNAVFGFANMLIKLLTDFAPVEAAVIAFDKSRRTFRTDIYDAYKGTRAKTPPELSSQLPKIPEFAAALGIKFIEIEGFEADDIIGTLTAKAAAAHDTAVYVVTGDRDALQLIGDNVRICYTQKGVGNLKIYDAAVFAEDYGGLSPVQLIDLKALMGDSSDNIPGIFGVGQKTALKLLQEYGTVENVLDNAENVKGAALKKKIAEGKESSLLSKKLATICRDVPDLAYTPDEYAVKPDRNKMRAFCDDNELKKVWQNFDKAFPAVEENLFAATANDTPPTVFQAANCSHNIADIAAFSAPVAVWADAAEGAVRWVAVASAGTATVYISCAAENPEAVCAEIEKSLNGKTVFVYDAKKLYRFGLRAQENFFDITLAAYLLRTEGGEKADDFAALIGEFLGENVPTEFAAPQDFACYAAQMTLKLGILMRQKLQNADMLKLLTDIEEPLAPILAQMEGTGIYVDKTHLQEKAAAAQERIVALQESIYRAAGEEFNISSPKQLSGVLFDKLGLKPTKKNKSGGYSTNAEVLGELKDAHPIVGDILDYRLWTKLKSTYLDGIGQLINPATGRVHTTFNQRVTATGRLSSSEPNLQNIPVRTDEGREIRACFEPGAGYDVIVSADYSQIELRVLAAMSNDANMILAFKNGEDIHAHTAAAVFGVPESEVTPLLRRRAKAINFGIVYGLSDYGLAKDLGISRKEAACYIDGYFAKYSAVKKFLDETVAFAKENGYVRTLFGRRRELPNITSANYNVRGMAERMAMNTPVQGTAADIIKLAMIAVAAKVTATKLKSRMLLQVHDELVFEAPNAEIETLSAILKDTMENAAQLAVPLLVNVAVGKNWSEAK